MEYLHGVTEETDVGPVLAISNHCMHSKYDKYLYFISLKVSAKV